MKHKRTWCHLTPVLFHWYWSADAVVVEAVICLRRVQFGVWKKNVFFSWECRRVGKLLRVILMQKCLFWEFHKIIQPVTAKYFADRRTLHGFLNRSKQQQKSGETKKYFFLFWENIAWIYFILSVINFKDLVNNNHSSGGKTSYRSKFR